MVWLVPQYAKVIGVLVMEILVLHTVVHSVMAITQVVVIVMVILLVTVITFVRELVHHRFGVALIVLQTNLVNVMPYVIGIVIRQVLEMT
jgi:hypothetical protein